MSEVKTQEEIQQEVRNLEAQLEHYMQVDPANVDKHNELANQISELNFSLAQMQERDVHTQEVNESNSDIAIAVFDALVPEPKVFESVLGLMEFSDWRSGFYQLFDAALADRTKLMDEKHVEELAQKDEKIRMLGRQGLEIQRQLDEARKKAEDAFKEIDDIEAKYGDLEIENSKLEDQLDEANQVITHQSNSITERAELIAELEAKLEAAQTPKEESKPSQSFTDRMHEIKSKNEARIKSAAELAAEGQLGFRGTIRLPEIRQQESQFRDFPAIESNGNQLPSAQVDATVGSQFPSAPAIGPVYPPDVATRNVSGESTHEQVEEKTDGERITELERRVDILFQNQNIGQKSEVA